MISKSVKSDIKVISYSHNCDITMISLFKTTFPAQEKEKIWAKPTSNFLIHLSNLFQRILHLDTETTLDQVQGMVTKDDQGQLSP